MSSPIARRIRDIDIDDVVADAVGMHLAQALKLKRDKDGQWPTLWGTKSSAGLARTALRLLLREPI